jgi:hypothetical protein
MRRCKLRVVLVAAEEDDLTEVEESGVNREHFGIDRRRIPWHGDHQVLLPMLAEEERVTSAPDLARAVDPAIRSRNAIPDRTVTRLQRVGQSSLTGPRLNHALLGAFGAF